MSGIIGVIADTHGLLRPEAVQALKGCALIIHVGDIGKHAILEQLQQLAPVVAIRGNNDHGPWAEVLPDTTTVTYQGLSLYVLHNLAELDCNPTVVPFHAVIAGHSHRPHIEEKAGVLYFNPGSAGPRRFKLPVALGRLHVTQGQLQPEIITLQG